jgi:hypothetical protein
VVENGGGDRNGIDSPFNVKLAHVSHKEKDSETVKEKCKAGKMSVHVRCAFL